MQINNCLLILWIYLFTTCLFYFRSMFSAQLIGVDIWICESGFIETYWYLLLET